MPTHDDGRREYGRALRNTVPRSSHAEWCATTDRRDPIAVLEEQGESRVAELLPIRYGRMARSPFAFFRGGAAIMAMDLASTPTTGLRVQACGDAHVGNFGKFASPERSLVFDINDFDETLPGPWEWDVKRLCTSLHIVAAEIGLSPAQCEDVVRTTSRAYRERVARAAASDTLEQWYATIQIDDVIAHFPKRYRAGIERDVARARRRDRRRAVAKLTHDHDGDGELRFAEDPPLVVHFDRTGADRADISSAFAQYRSTLPDDRKVLLDRFRLVDVARKVVGVGSVGTACWIALFEGASHRPSDRMILQIKEAQASVLAPYAGAPPIDHQGRRVVTGQRLTQAASDIFLGWAGAPGSGRHYYVRQLWDFKGQSDPAKMDFNNLEYYGALCAWALARAHARTGDAVKISAYLGKGDRFDRALAQFATSYAATNARDYAALLDAIASGRLEADRDS